MQNDSGKIHVNPRRLLVSVGMVLVAVGLLKLVSVINRNISIQKFVNNPILDTFICKIQSDKLGAGKRIFPANLSELSADGCCYITRKDSGIILVFIPDGKGLVDKYGYLHVNRPLQITDYIDGEEHGAKANTIAVSRQGQEQTLQIKSQLSLSWYYVVERFN